MALTYTELIRRTPAWIYAQNRDIVAEMPVIVAQAHEQLFNVIDHDFFRTLVPGLTLDTTGIIEAEAQVPEILEVRAVRLRYRKDGEFTPLFMRELEMLTMLYAENRPGRPRYYAEYDGPLVYKVFPQPPAPMQYELTANVKCPVLSPTVANNLLGDRAERALEKATFRQAALYMKDQAAAGTYEQEMMAAVVELNSQIGRRRRDETGQKPKETTNTTGA